ncbi:MAG: phospho-sugar mutase [Bacteroidetes bacterium]|jgi:phosphoglucomutase|nr:phospho-sugar mutase [Bacteroidota bacterium]
MHLPQEITREIQRWLGSDYDEHTRQRVQSLVDDQKESELMDAFYTKLEFGTGGLRGLMGPGPNRMNQYTVGVATQGFANYLNNTIKGQEIKVVVACDSRHQSQYFAQITAQVFAANGCRVYLYPALRPTPQLSFTIRYLACHAGVMITASHNPKEYNGYKAYWSDGGQLLSPHDRGVMDEVNRIGSVAQVRFQGGSQRIETLDESLDQVYRDALHQLSFDNGFVARQSNMPITYSSLHGTGITQVPQTLARWGFANVHVVDAQAEPNGQFPTVIYPNPEEEEAMTLCLRDAAAHKAVIAMATDPDSDRVGLGIEGPDGRYALLNGNQIASLLVDYVLKLTQENQAFKPGDYVVRTIVSTPLIDKIAHKYGVQVYHTLTGFKYIGDLITRLQDNQRFLVGGEESYGYMVGSLTRDKDAVVSCAFLAEMAAYYQDKGMSIMDVLINLYLEHGLYREKLVSITKKGKQGTEEIADMMARLRRQPPSTLGGVAVVQVWDYHTSTWWTPETSQQGRIDLPKSNVLQFVTHDGCTVSARPSGTEPKIKFYCSVRGNLTDKACYQATLAKLDAKLDAIMGDLLAG